jgi:multidrug efflux pump subunit AcrA (membrane-fusion protein)
MMMKMRVILAAAIVAPAFVLAGCAAATNASSGQAAGSGTQAAASRGGTGAQGGAGRQGTLAQGAAGRRFAAISVQAVPVLSAPLVTDNDTAGTVMPVTQSQVAAQVSGVVLKVVHKAGDFVAQGAAVIQLDDATLRLSEQNAQAALDNAKINLAMGQQNTSESNPKLADQLQATQGSLTAAQKNYDSQKALYDLGGISSAQLDNAKSALNQAQANVEAAKAALDQNSTADTQNIAQLKLAVDQATNQLAIAQLSLQNATIRAPFAGQLAAVNVTPGMYVNVNTSAFLLVSTDKQISFTEPPTDAPTFRIGDVVQFTYAGKSYPVKLVQTPSAPINSVVPMVASVPASMPVSYGAVGTVTYKLTIATGPQIPLSALQSRANINYVDTIVNGKATEVPVTILAEAGTTAVVQGVQAGDQVVINPPPGLLNGATVQVVALPVAQGQGTTTGKPGQGGAGGAQSGQYGGAGGTRTGSSSGGGTQTGQNGGGTQTGQYSGQRTGGQRTGSRQGQTSGGTATGSTQPATGGTP